jgi:CHAT domain-containing protein
LLGKLTSHWLQPLEAHLAATAELPAVRRLLVVPAGPLAGVPVDALSDRYLVSFVPSGTIYARLCEARVAAPRESPSRLLALGDPVFQVEQSKALSTPGFPPLPGTRREVQALAAYFPEHELLLGSAASEQRLQALAGAGRLAEFRFIHLATHGQIDDQAPRQSALILAQDQLPPPAELVRLGRTPLTGRLTLHQIHQSWKLQADLVTLSACRSGAGTAGGGDGNIGFSQALLLAGARSVVLSLWQVDDTATALLMVRFYENLLGKRQGAAKPMPKAEALQEAKRWLRQLTRAEAETRLANLPEAARGLRLEPATQPPAPTDRPFEHPYYWSAFVLIGDPE